MVLTWLVSDLSDLYGGFSLAWLQRWRRRDNYDVLLDWTILCLELLRWSIATEFHKLAYNIEHRGLIRRRLVISSDHDMSVRDLSDPESGQNVSEWADQAWQRYLRVAHCIQLKYALGKVVDSSRMDGVERRLSGQHTSSLWLRRRHPSIDFLDKGELRIEAVKNRASNVMLNTIVLEPYEIISRRIELWSGGLWHHDAIYAFSRLELAIASFDE